MYMNYAADDLRAQGRLTAREVLIDRLTARAYQAKLSSTTGSIGLANPYPYRFRGSMSELDLRFIPENVPVPRVESLLDLDYDVVGSFSRPFITGEARFRESTYLGATIRDGMAGTIDTAGRPIRYSGDGVIDGIDLQRFGEGLGVGWLQDPRYAGTVSGRFRVEGAGSGAETLALTADGRISRAELFRGVLADADVSLVIDQGTLSGAFNGRLAGVDPAVPFGDARLAASLAGLADVRTTVRDLLIRTPSLADYEVSGRLALGPSTIRGLRIDGAAVDGALADERLTVVQLDVSAPALDATASGLIALNGRDSSDFQYDVTRADLAALQPITGGSAKGLAITKGRLTGPTTALRAAGAGTLSGLDAFGINALAIAGDYDATIPSGPGDPRPSAHVTGRATFVEIFGQAMEEVSGTIALADDRAEFSLTMTQTGRRGDIAGTARLHLDRRSIDLLGLDITIGSMPWRLIGSEAPPTVAWSDAGITISPMAFATGHEDDQRIDVAGTWRSDGAGALRVTARNAFLETFQGAGDRPARYGGVVDLDATIRGTRNAPLVTGTVTISNGRVERVTYERLVGRIDFSQGAFTIDARLDQAPGTWLTAKGTVPLALFDRSLPERAIDVAIVSSDIDLGLIAGVTDVVSGAAGRMRLDVHAIGTSDDPHFEGSIDMADAAFVVTATGVQYRNGRAAVLLARDRVTVDSLHLEDEDGQPLDVRGSLGTHELRVGELEIDLTADRFRILQNEFGRLDINATLALRGQFELPRLAGDLTIAGDNLQVDRILERALFQPYSTEAVTLASLDAVAALNPWDRLGLDIFLRIPRTLRLVGRDVQVSPGTPIGLGDIDLRVGGDLYLYKDPADLLYVTGSLDQVSGTYAFQGRRFEIDEAGSSINFVGDLNPQLWVTVRREISGVETRVTLSGSLRQPELQLASTPPLEESDVLSLIVFNTTPDGLTSLQQQELAVRAGTLAAGFLAQPLIQALQTELGLEAFEIEPGGEAGSGPTITIAEELAPGLVARFSRQFGQDPWNQATIEYYLSRLFRIRATFSDAQSITARAAFRRVERAGIDLLVFFSF
jgi:autotransporter translocation and assembly factor TamB